MIRSVITLSLLLVPSVALAHSGATDTRGGHRCETNCERYDMRYGQYHFHTATMTDIQKKRYDRFRESLCNRVQKRFARSPLTFERVNTRVKNRFGFTCGGLGSEPQLTFTQLRKRLRAETALSDSHAADRATVNRVIDGDTLEVIVGDGRKETVRIIGIDAPEVESKDQAGQCYAGEAFVYLRNLLSGNRAELQHRPGDNRDKYGRLLRYIEFRGRDVGFDLLTAGYAKNYPWFEHPRSESYSKAEIHAKKNLLGLWSVCTP